MGGAISWLLLSVLYLLVRVVRPEAGLSSLNDARYKVQATMQQPLMLVSFFIKYTRLHCVIKKKLVSSFGMEPSELSSQKPFVPFVRRGVILILEYQSVCPFVLIGSLALSPASVSPFWIKRGGNTRLRVRGRWEPIRTT
jgi:hypothetical protein